MQQRNPNYRRGTPRTECVPSRISSTRAGRTPLKTTSPQHPKQLYSIRRISRLQEPIFVPQHREDDDALGDSARIEFISGLPEPSALHKNRWLCGWTTWPLPRSP